MACTTPCFAPGAGSGCLANKRTVCDHPAIAQGIPSLKLHKYVCLVVAMGSNWSSLEDEPVPDPWWPLDRPRTSTVQSVRNEELSEPPSRGTAREEELEALKQELARKRALRHEALAALQAELRDLRSRVDEETNLRRKAEEERDKLKALTRVELQKELESEKEEKKKLLEERDRLIEVVEEKAGLERQVQALKDVSQIGKEMLRIRELQVKELKKKLVEMNISSVVAPPEDLRIEYEKQIENIRKLRTLYEERATATLLEHRRELERDEARIAVLETKLSDVQKELDDYKEVKKELETKIEKLEFTIQENDHELDKTKDALFSSSVQNSTLNSQMTLINNLFSQMLVSPEVDLDRLTRLLKEHHGLITDLTTKGDSNEVAALLVELAEQMDKEQESDEKVEQIDDDNSSINKQLQSEIASNLSKVWRVMIELLSHHQTPSHPEHAGGADSCYKSIQTPSGPRSVISVSQTFLTLKDLILEKNRLVKEVGRLKTLNDHLENRLGNQEKRLSVVTTELRKTWSVVNKLKAQHKQLHTHEKILRYELQQKRCMLTELKGELEHCKDKWEKARQKNSQTEEDWKKLRKEFAARKSRNESNSAESGYEEEDVQTPPSEPHKYMRNLYEPSKNEVSEPELSEEDIEHSDGNSFDTVIELIDCIDSQQRHQPEVSFVLCDVPPQTLELPSNLLPLSGSEFTEGLDQIESEDLAAVLDIQYQTQLLGADYNLSLPSSSGSSPIPTDNDDFTSSEVDISEEDMSSNDNHVYSSPLPHTNQTVSEDVLLFGSNSSKNISRFLDGLFVESEESLNTKTQTSPKVSLNIPSSSKTDDNDLTPTPFNNESLFPSSADLSFKVNENLCSFFSDSNNVDGKSNPGNEQTQSWYPSHCQLYQLNKTEEASNGQSSDQVNETSSELVEKTQDELLNAREERLKRLEHQCRSLVNKVTSTSFRSEIISNKLDELHLAYGPVDHDNNDDCFPKEKSNSKQEAAAQCQVDLLSGPSTSQETLPLQGRDIEEQETNLSSSSQIESHLPNPTESDTAASETRTAKLKRLEDQCKCLYSKISTKSNLSRSSPSKIESLPRRLSVPLSENTLATSVQPTCSKRPILDNKTNAPNVISQEDLTKFVPNSQEDQELKQTELPGEPNENFNQCSPGPSLEPISVAPSHSCEGAKKHRSPEEILEARAERFKRLEDQCKSLLSKMTATSLRSEIISNKLDELHSCYGSSEDASDSEEHSLLSKNAEKRLISAPSSSRHNKQTKALCGNNEPTQSTTLPNSDTINSVNDEVQECSQINVLTENVTDINHDGNTALLRRISEEILPEEDKRINTSQNERDPNLNDT